MTRVVAIGYVVKYFIILLDDCGELRVSSWWGFLEAIGKSSKVMITLLYWCWPIIDVVMQLKYVLCCYAYMMGYVYVECEIMVKVW